MSEFTQRELAEKLLECAGEAEDADVSDEAVLDTPFLELGYDSLALLQVTGVIKREYGVELSDDAVVEAETPRLLLKMINANLPDAV
ncbi:MULTISPECIES: acyl carrier protein [Streptomyces]|uniref:Act minimal PKS acyl carrier protein n=1 Tax=Streptomyces qinglanensis TaxID=943816 RepID=A0A1E7K2T3_9ACTN|nr:MULTISPECIES: acyl carrier protein [Streptomyces]OEU98238.1 actinorhodin polyketide synthase [Streptomyces qinglanensis]OEV24829.1 actinorhodin polyketide synthase [Streptomyces nanshensis]SER32719.1 act minimal PKS acyl carrier protein [Streptomyces qinglanensis]